MLENLNKNNFINSSTGEHLLAKMLLVMLNIINIFILIVVILVIQI